MGLLVVALWTEGARDSVQDGNTGYPVNVEGHTDQEQVVLYRDRLAELVERSDLRRSMGIAAQQLASQCTWDEAMKSFVTGYTEVLKQTPSLIAA